MKIVLASSSIRRRQLLGKLIDDFDIYASSFCEESIDFRGNCGEYVMNLALGKAQDVCSKMREMNTIIIGCDTVVYFRGNILGKPRDRDDAFNMLKSLSANEHDVYSGVAIINKASGLIKRDFVKTTVRFSDISDEQIEKYLNTSEYKDKAGAYGIQGYGGVFVPKIHGCYYNVVGLPLNKLREMLTGMGVNL